MSDYLSPSSQTPRSRPGGLYMHTTIVRHFEMDLPVPTSLHSEHIHPLLDEMVGLAELLELDSTFTLMHRDLFYTITNMGLQLFQDDPHYKVRTKVQFKVAMPEDKELKDIRTALELAAAVWVKGSGADFEEVEIWPMQDPLNELCASFDEKNVQLFATKMKFSTPRKTTPSLPSPPSLTLKRPICKTRSTGRRLDF